MRSIHALLHSLIDYAGLFPPAELGMSAAVASYSSYRASDHAWVLGRFVVPLRRLAEFERVAAPCLPTAGAPWRLAALAGPDLAADLTAIDGFNRRHAGRVAVESIELKAETPRAIAAALETIGRRLDAYVEVPVVDDPAPLIVELARLGGRAKVRTGGVTSQAFPSPPELLRFLQRCVAAGVPFKATAGLHHPLRGSYPLTYAPGSPSGTMFGFLNVLLTAALLEQGGDPADGLALIEETSPEAFRFDDLGVVWCSHVLGEAALRRCRRQSVLAFGSCSFQEPIDDLEALGLL